jgi:hypothetical protein
LRRYTLSATLCALLVGCGGSQPPIGAPGAIPPSAHTRKGTSTALLYVSNQNNWTVSVFTYPSGELQQTLSGFESPTGLCSDKAGDVWVVDHEPARIIEYAHGASEPSRTLTDAGKRVISCSVDPVTGDLAVTNFSSNGLGQGSFSIYKRATGTPRIYKDKSLYRDWYCSYDNQGNLFVDGTSGPTSGFQLAELAHGSTKFTNITLDQAISSPGGVQWDGAYLAIADQDALKETVVYQFALNGSVGTEVSSTQLNHSTYVPREFWIDPAARLIVRRHDGQEGWATGDSRKVGARQRRLLAWIFPWALRSVTS